MSDKSGQPGWARRENNDEPHLNVEYYAGHEADERPLHFRFATRKGRIYRVEEILDRWYEVRFQCYKIRAADGTIYLLGHGQADDCSTLDAHRPTEN